MMKPTLSQSLFFRFLILAYGFSWMAWVPAAILKQDLMSFPTLLLHTLGGFGPSLAGILMIYQTRDSAGRRDFWQRILDFRRVGFTGILGILLLFPILTLASISLSYLIGGPLPEFSTVEHLTTQPLLIIQMLLIGLIGGPIPEELGWRGFALDALQRRWSILVSSILLGSAWSFWHFPLFFIAGTPQYSIGIGTLDFWLFMLNPIPLSVLIAWVYYRTGSSICSAILMHLGINFTANLFYPLPLQSSIIQSFLLVMAASFVLRLPHTGNQQVQSPEGY